MLLRERKATLDAVTINQSNLTLGLEREVMRNLDIYDLSLRSAASGLQLLDPTMSPAAQQAVLFDGSTAARYFRPILLSDGSGNVLRDAGSPTPRIASVADRPFFEVQRTGKVTGLLVQLYLRGGITNRPYLSLSRRVSAADGSFQGVVSGGLDLDYFSEIFSHYTLLTGGAVAIVGFDSRMVAGVPSRTGMTGRDVSGGGLVEQARLLKTGSFETTSVVDGIKRVATVRQLGTLPFFLVVGEPSAVVYAEWERRAWAIGCGLFIFAVVFCLLFGTLYRELGRRREAERLAVDACQTAQASERRFVTYVDQLADGIMAIRKSPEGTFRYERINAAAGEMLDVRPVDAIGRCPHEVWPASVARLVEDRLARCVTSDEPLRYEHHHQGHNGHSRVLRFVLAPVREVPDGPVTLLLASLRDVTDTIEMEAQLRQSQRLEAVGQLTAGVAHDFNNMLQVQFGALSLIESQLAETSGLHHHVQIALAAGERGAALTQSLLSFSRKQTLTPCRVPVADLLECLDSMLSRTLGPQIVLQVQAADGPLAPFADVAQLENALLNLALNARDAMPDGGMLQIEARPSTMADSVPAGFTPSVGFLFVVSDSGTGMEPHVAAKACEPFFTTKKVGKGSGLGLSMVQGFVQQSNGAMRIVSAPGQGTRIELWLPLAQIVTRSDEAVSPHPAVSPGGSVRAPTRLLLVDDDPDLLEVTAALLENSGFEVIQVSQGAAALSLLETAGAFDMLMTDYMMPGMNGAELARQAVRLIPDLPVLVLTGYAEVEGLRELPVHVEVVYKPIGGRPLIQSVLATLDRAEQRRLGSPQTEADSHIPA